MSHMLQVKTCSKNALYHIVFQRVYDQAPQPLAFRGRTEVQCALNGVSLAMSTRSMRARVSPRLGSTCIEPRLSLTEGPDKCTDRVVTVSKKSKEGQLKIKEEQTKEKLRIKED